MSCIKPTYVVLAMAALIAAPWAAAQVPVKNGNGASLESLEGTDTLVTVVIKGTGAIEPNCRVVDIGPNYFAVNSANGYRNAYMFADVSEIRVQEGAVAHELFKLSDSVGLTEDEQVIFDAAVATAGDVFERAISNQDIRLQAAVLLGLAGKDAGEQYLRQRAEGNDILLALRAHNLLKMFTEVEISDDLIRSGLANSDPRVRAITMLTIATFERDEYTDHLMEAVGQRLAQTSAPAALALGYMEEEAAVPALLDMILGLNAVKAESALWALVQIGGPEVIDGLKDRLPNAAGMARYRLIEALTRLDDPIGMRLMKDEALRIPTLQDRAAIQLVAKGDLDARGLLEERLSERYEPTFANLIGRGQIAVALLRQGDNRRVADLQTLVTDQNPLVQVVGLSLCVEAGARTMLPILEAPLSSPNELVAISACYAVFACSNPEFHKLLSTSLDALQDRLSR